MIFRPRVWRTILGTREGRIGVPLGVVMVIVIAGGRFTAPYPPDKIGVAIPGSPPSGHTCWARMGWAVTC